MTQNDTQTCKNGAFLWIFDCLQRGFPPDWCSLSRWSAQLAERAYDELIAPSPACDRARLHCLAGGCYGAWLDVCLATLSVCVSQDLNIAYSPKMRLRQPIFLFNDNLTCNQCGDCTDPFGDHLRTRSAAGPDKLYEHSDAYNVDGCDDIERVLRALSSDGEPMQ